VFSWSGRLAGAMPVISRSSASALTARGSRGLAASQSVTITTTDEWFMIGLFLFDHAVVLCSIERLRSEEPAPRGGLGPTGEGRPRRPLARRSSRPWTSVPIRMIVEVYLCRAEQIRAQV